MPIKKKGKAPAAKAKAKVEEAAEAVLDAAVGAVFVGKAKLTISVKRRLSNGDEVFIAPGIELDGLAEDLDATKATVTDHVNGWLDDLLAAYPDSDPIDDEEEEDDDADDEEEEDDDADADDEDEDDDDEEGEDLTEDEIKKNEKGRTRNLGRRVRNRTRKHQSRGHAERTHRSAFRRRRRGRRGRS